jgi:hypothetical protein
MERSGATAGTPSPPVPSSATGRPRRTELDNLKTALAVGVISAHAVLTYADGGDWFYQERNLGQVATVLTLVPGLVGALFAMGLFFLIGGWFTPASFARKGAGRFLLDRLVKLGLPFVAFIVVVTPAVNTLVAYRARGAHGPVVPFFAERVTDLDSGPLWFVGVLLLFSTVYALWRRFAPTPVPTDQRFGARVLVVMALGIAASSFLLRLQFPMDSHQIMNLHVFQWPQFAAMFALGAVSAERGWLREVPTTLRRRCGQASLIALDALLLTMAAGGAFAEHASAKAFAGGVHWESLATAAIEGTLAVSAAIWVLGWFGERWTRETPLSRLLARSAYGAYVWQTPVLVVGALLLRELTVVPEVRLAILLPGAVLTSFALSCATSSALRRSRRRHATRPALPVPR